MERVELVGANVFVLRTRQLGPRSWCCDVFERHQGSNEEDSFILEDFGESELEAVAMALSDAHH